jgi:beta-1,2-mannosidase
MRRINAFFYVSIIALVIPVFMPNHIVRNGGVASTKYSKNDTCRTDLMTADYQRQLKQIYEEAAKKVGKNHISMLDLGKQYESYPDWCIGPFSNEASLTFKKPRQWNDPTNIGWKSGFLFNPSVIGHDGKLFMFYRAAPQKEALSSRVGLAVYTPGSGWEDYRHNPVIYSTTEDEVISVEDPKVYEREDGTFIMFYNGVSPTTDEIRADCASTGDKAPGIVCTIKAAVSRDLYTWDKIGSVVPTSVSRYWAKAAVIPRDPSGKAVRINGRYMMYISEGCGGKQYIGFSTNLVDWTFEQHTYLEIGDMGIIREVACAVTHYHSNERLMLLDFYYQDKTGMQCASQAKYSLDDPFTQEAVNRGGTLSWGGIIQYDGKWLFAQGWDATPNAEEMYFYTAPIRK